MAQCLRTSATLPEGLWFNSEHSCVASQLSLSPLQRDPIPYLSSADTECMGIQTHSYIEKRKKRNKCWKRGNIWFTLSMKITFNILELPPYVFKVPDWFPKHSPWAKFWSVLLLLWEDQTSENTYKSHKSKTERHDSTCLCRKQRCFGYKWPKLLAAKIK